MESSIINLLVIIVTMLINTANIVLLYRINKNRNPRINRYPTSIRQRLGVINLGLIGLDRKIQIEELKTRELLKAQDNHLEQIRKLNDIVTNQQTRLGSIEKIQSETINKTE